MVGPGAQSRRDAGRNAPCADRGRLKDVDRIDVRLAYVRPCEIGIPAFTLAELDHVGVFDERPLYTRPIATKCFAPSRDKGEVHSGRGPEVAVEVEVAWMAKIAVAIDVEQAKRPFRTRTGERTHQDGAVAPDDERELSVPPGISNRIGQRQVEIAHGSAVAHSRPGLWPRRVDRAWQVDDGRHTRCLQESRSGQGHRRAPCAGFVIEMEWAKPEVGWSGDHTHGLGYADPTIASSSGRHGFFRTIIKAEGAQLHRIADAQQEIFG